MVTIVRGVRTPAAAAPASCARRPARSPPGRPAGASAASWPTRADQESAPISEPAYPSGIALGIGPRAHTTVGRKERPSRVTRPSSREIVSGSLPPSAWAASRRTEGTPSRCSTACSAANSPLAARSASTTRDAHSSSGSHRTAAGDGARRSTVTGGAGQGGPPPWPNTFSP
ncbi:hypothetical protein ACFQES_49950 [Nonomuraea salmonea]|uniref:hypothetical protein n=1 Tax=Nonomuraea salmonea TaxID=46181 RepID=UPI00361660C9